MNRRDFFVAGITLLVILAVWAVGRLFIPTAELKNVVLTSGFILLFISFTKKN